MRLPGVLAIAVSMMLASVLRYPTVEGSPQEHPEQFYYPYVRPTVASNAALTPKFYPDNHDFTDYSMHFTRSDPSSRNSGAEPPPSGPYFAHELKSYYHNPAQHQQQKAVYQTSWNMIDSDGNDYTPYQRPSSHVVNNNPSLAQFASDEEELAFWQQLQQRPIVRKPIIITKKPIRKKQKNNKRPVQPGFQKHPNSIDKVSDIAGPQSIASAYPNGVMGTLSLMAGLVWYMVNKSATPVIKMRSSSSSSSSREDSNEQDSSIEIPAKLNELVNHWWDSLKQTDCQQRAVCELVTEYPFISKATRWSKSVFRMPMMQKTIKTLREENESSLNLKSLSKMAMLFRAASHAERGVDCSAFFPDCPLTFRAEDRD